MFDRAQLRKGTLEGCILKIISREPMAMPLPSPCGRAALTI